MKNINKVKAKVKKDNESLLYVVHCNTFKKAKKFLKVINKLGYCYSLSEELKINFKYAITASIPSLMILMLSFNETSQKNFLLFCICIIFFFVMVIIIIYKYTTNRNYIFKSNYRYDDNTCYILWKGNLLWHEDRFTCINCNNLSKFNRHYKKIEFDKQFNFNNEYINFHSAQYEM